MTGPADQQLRQGEGGGFYKPLSDCCLTNRGGCAAVSSQCSRLAVMVATTWASSSPGIPRSGTADDLMALKVSIIDKSGFFLGALSGVVIAIGDS